jgi:hypothetical protein
MAHGTKAAAAPTAPTNGDAGAHGAAPGPVNRKKQKRREKEAAKKAAEQQKQQQDAVAQRLSTRQQAPQYAEPEYDDPPYDDEGDYFSDDDGESYPQAYASNGQYQPGYAPAPGVGGAAKKKKKGPPPPPQQNPHSYHHTPPRPPHMSHISAHVARAGPKNIWNTTTVQERESIREFWLSLSEDERKSLVKIEKEAVLRKMKEQQKHSCSCSVCGRKRTAIEEELEVLYDAYYEELERYALRDADPHLLY